MKKVLMWMLAVVLMMLGCPWLAVTFAGSAGMAVCFLLFFVVNPLFSAACGIFAGKNIKQYWVLPIVTVGLYLVGVWLFFEMGEPDFLIYGAGYLVIGAVAMLLRALVYQ